MRQQLLIFIFLCLVMVGLQACMVNHSPTSYKNLTQPHSQQSQFFSLTRDVYYYTSLDFANHTPTCMILLPPKKHHPLTLKSHHIASIQLTQHVKKIFTNATVHEPACPYKVVIHIPQAKKQFMGVVSYQSIIVELALYHTSSTSPLWYAKHDASSHAGGVSLNPFSAMVDGIEAFNHSHNDEETSILLYKAITRMLKTMPKWHS